MKIYDMIDSIQNTVYILVQNIRKDKKEKNVEARTSGI